MNHLRPLSWFAIGAAALVAGPSFDVGHTRVLAKDARAAQKDPLPPFPELPRFEDLFKNPQNLPEEQQRLLKEATDRMRAEMQRAREDYRRAMERGGFVPRGPAALNPRGTTPSDVRLGIVTREPPPVLVDQLGLSPKQGVVVDQVLPDSAAARAGLREHDVLLKFAGKDVPTDPQEFRQLVLGAKAKERVDVEVLRRGKRETVKGLVLPEVPAELGPGANPQKKAFGKGLITEVK